MTLLRLQSFSLANKNLYLFNSAKKYDFTLATKRLADTKAGNRFVPFDFS